MHRFHRLDFGAVDQHAVQNTHFPGDALDRQAVGAVGRQVHVNGDIVQLQVVRYVLADRSVRGELHQAIVIVGQPQLRLGTEHALGGLAAKLGLLDFEITGQDRTNHCKRHLHSFTDIGSATNHLHFRSAVTDLADPQFICVRMWTYRFDLSNDYAVELTGHRLETVHFQTCHGDLVH